MGDRDQFYKGILDNLYDGVYFVDLRRRITYWNKGAERISGFAGDKVIGSSCADNLLIHVNGSGELLCTGNCPLARTMTDGEMREVDIFMHHADGHRVPVSVRVSPIYDEQEKVIGAVEVFSDNSTKIAALERMEQLKEAALLDALTETGNRRYAEMRINAAIAELNMHDLSFGLLFLDIDDFKSVNDSYGHQVGDRVLKMVANTLRSNIRSYDFVGRWGGDEFLVVLVNVNSRGLLAIAQKLHALVGASKLNIHNDDIQVTASMGATLARKQDTMAKLIQRADRLMYQSKSGGRNRITAG